MLTRTAERSNANLSGAVMDHRNTPFAMLIVDDEEEARKVCADVAEENGMRVRTAKTTEEALEILEQVPMDVVVTDLRVPELGGLDLLRHVRQHFPQIAVLVMTQYGTIESAVEATRLGAVDFVVKPFHLDDLRAKLDRVAHALDLERENRVLREELRTRPGFGELVGVSARMQRVYQLIEKVGPHTCPVLILGESGTGKELVAQSIHFASPRRDRAFIPVDCSALVPTLIESELFGYVKGAFTGATQNRHGLLEAAAGGTLFLDEIGDLPIDLQAKLLRALQEREIKPVGSSERVNIDVRVIAATNRDLEDAIRKNQFRQDLFFRLNVVQIKLPPLRDRKNDIPMLVNSFLEKFSPPQRPLTSISEEAMGRLMDYDWPGNVRELENAVERAVALGSGQVLTLNDLPTNLQHGIFERRMGTDELVSLEELERRAIYRALRETGGDKLAAARLLGIGKTTLYRKLKQYEDLNATQN